MDSAPRRNERHAADMDPRHGLGRTEKGNYLESHVPPSFSRQPPDGHEFPTHYEETVRDSFSRTDDASSEQRKKLSPPIAVKTTRTLEETLKRISTSYVDSYKQRGWRNDEKSEKSVKDKIAMFSSANGDTTRTQPLATRKLNRYKSSDDVNVQNEGAMPSLFSNSEIVNDENVKLNSTKKGYFPYTSLVDVSASINAQSDSPPPEKTRSTLDLSSATEFAYETGPTPGDYSTLPRNYDARIKHFREDSDPASTSLSRALSFTGQAKIHGRSQSLIDVGSKLDQPTGKSTEDARKSSLNALIEQRRKSMSKLRGLVIPEKVVEGPAPQYILDLPEIKSKDYLVVSGRGSNSGNGTGTVTRGASGDRVDLLRKMSAPVGALTLPVTPWKGDLPKYSPAFKRKSLSIYGTPSSVSSLSSSRSSSREELRNCFESSKHFLGADLSSQRSDDPGDSTKCLTTAPQSRSGTESLENCSSPSISERSFDSACNNQSLNPKIARDGTTNFKVYEESSLSKLNPEVRVTEEESDNDSAVSSSRSSISHGFSPPISPMPDVRRLDKGNGPLSGSQSSVGGRVLKRTLSSETTASTSSNGSTLTSGSQASCSSLCSSHSSDSRRVLKAQSVEAINRKNVLSSARYSSGQDLKVGSPPMQMIRPDCVRTSIEKNSTLLKDSDSPFPKNEIFSVTNKTEEFDKALSSQVSVNSLEKQQDSKNEMIEIDHSSKKRNCDISDDNVMLFQNDDDLKYSKCKYTDEIGDNILELRESLRQDLSISNKIEPTWENNNCKRNNNAKYPTTQSGLKIGPSIQAESKLPISVKSGVSSQKFVCVNDIKKAFEKGEQSLIGRIRTNAAPVLHPRVSSIDSTNSDESLATTPTHYGSASDLLKEQQFGSITSLASSTSLISQQELSQLIEDSNLTIEEGGCSQEVEVVILHRDTAGSSVGIILAGGVDCEAKDITVHKVLSGSPAEKDGRIQKGDRIISINGKSMKGLSHLDSISILKAPRPEVVLVVSRNRSDTAAEDSTSRIAVPLRQPRTQEHISPLHAENASEGRWGNITSVILIKDGAGLGFSLEGGKDSPFGDQPLTIKKIFTGGCAEKCGQLHAGDELLSVNNTDLSGLSRIEAWALMKRLPDGKVQLNIRHPVT